MDVFNNTKCNKHFCNMEHKVVAASHIILMDSFSLPVDCDRFTNYRLVNASSVYYHHSIGVFKYSHIVLNWKWTTKNRASDNSTSQGCWKLFWSQKNEKNIFASLDFGNNPIYPIWKSHGRAWISEIFFGISH